MLKKNEFLRNALILPLHGNLSTLEQELIFDRPPENKRKIIVSTNIAETSVTVNDVVYVVDSGRVKEIQYDTYSNCPALVETWASRASTRQRMGRAGRVQEGVCYQLFSQRIYSKVMLDYQIPEIKRKSLEDLILQILLLELSESCPSEFLRKAIEPPDSNAIDNALSHLCGIQAIAKDCQGKYNLTPLGFHLASLPVGSPRLVVEFLLNVSF